MLNTDKEWQPFMKDIAEGIKIADNSERRVLKSTKKIAEKKGYVTINQYMIACGILDDLDKIKEKK